MLYLLNHNLSSDWPYFQGREGVAIALTRVEAVAANKYWGGFFLQVPLLHNSVSIYMIHKKAHYLQGVAKWLLRSNLPLVEHMLAKSTF